MATIAAMIGDPAGIGPEVIVKALAGAGRPDARVLLVGSADAVAERVHALNAPLRIRRIRTYGEALFEPGTIDVLDGGELDPASVRFGTLSAACGRAVTRWWDTTMQLALDGRVDAVIKAPVNFEAIRLAGENPQAAAGPARTHLALLTGPLRIIHLTDHIPLREVFAQVRHEAIANLLRLTHRTLLAWGVGAPRIGVAGLNPHAVGDEEQSDIAPAIDTARQAGIDAHGPVPPDSLFRQCAEGEYDCVVAHYHDQGHIAAKTWRFGDGCAAMLGEPFLRISIPHGTAFDIAGRGVADSRSMASALQHAAWLGSGKGFPDGAGHPPSRRARTIP